VTIVLDAKTVHDLEQIARQRAVEPSALAVQAIREFLHAEAQQAMKREADAFRRLHPELLATVPGQYVAIHNGELVDHDTDQLALLERIQSHYPRLPVLIRAVQPEAEQTIIVRSPRIEHA